MVPTPITEDYYTILNVVQTAPLGLIVRSYRRQALELHPDRNTRPDATAAFQLVSEFLFAAIKLDALAYGRILLC
jgi:curved DNA-binding protein CbpA